MGFFSKCLVSIFIFAAQLTFSQSNNNKIYFDKSGKQTAELQSYYYRVNTGKGGIYKSYYTNGGAISFEGGIINASETDENLNVYTGKCTWYYKNGKKKAERKFNTAGQENGLTTYYYESGKVWKEIEFINGTIANNTISEYDEDGILSKIFEEKFDNNNKDWDLYTSDKTSARLNGGKLFLTSFTNAGAARFIGIPNVSEDFTLEAVINIQTLKDGDKAGIIYGFKDWQNYNFYLISKKGFFIGFVYEGVIAMKVEGMYSSEIRPNDANLLKIIAIGDKNIYSINGAIQYSSDRTKNFGSSLGFSVSGKNTVSIESLTFKQINYSGNSSSEKSREDANVQATGSGVILTVNGYVLTNYHVVENANKLFVEINIGGTSNTYHATLIEKDKDNDLAILKIDDSNFKQYNEVEYSFLDNGGTDVGTSVFTIGFPYALSGMGKSAKFTDGKISSKTGYNGAVNSFQTSIPIQPGNSGSPLFNNKGQLIGIMNAYIREADNVSYAIKLNYIKNLMELLPETPAFPSKNIAQLSTEEKVKVLTKYVVLIKVK